MGYFDAISGWISANPGKALGSLAGLVLGILIIVFGPLKALFVLILAALGFLIGKIRDEQISPVDALKGLFRRNRE